MSRSKCILPNERKSKRTKFRSKCKNVRDPFDCHLCGKKCSGTKMNGAPCTRNTYRPYEMCWQHLRREKKLNVSGDSARTTLKRNGVRYSFKGLKAWVPASTRKQRERKWDAGQVHRNTKKAKYVKYGPENHRWNYCNIAFRPKNHIARYVGEIINNARKEERYGNQSPPYVIRYGENFIDGGCKRGVINYANHKPHSQANATFQEYHDMGTGNDEIRLLSKKNIYNGQEIFVSYGRGYRMGQCTHSTK